MQLGCIIRIFRTVNGMTTEGLAEYCYITSKFLSDVELGDKMPTLHTLSKLCEAFKIPRSLMFKIQEDSDEFEWDFRTTMDEIKKLYEKNN